MSRLRACWVTPSRPGGHSGSRGRAPRRHDGREPCSRTARGRTRDVGRSRAEPGRGKLPRVFHRQAFPRRYHSVVDLGSDLETDQVVPKKPLLAREANCLCRRDGGWARVDSDSAGADRAACQPRAAPARGPADVGGDHGSGLANVKEARRNPHTGSGSAWRSGAGGAAQET
jgi:hypothetical protein